MAFVHTISHRGVLTMQALGTLAYAEDLGETDADPMAIITADMERLASNTGGR
jgi:hypothetical protein